MEHWDRKVFTGDPKTDAILNVADALHAIAASIDRLLYAFKYSQQDGLSVAEAIVSAADTIASSEYR